MTALEAAALIAPRIDKDLDSSKSEIYELLTLINNKFWKEGSWRGMHKHFHVDVKRDHEGKFYFVAPNEYNVLEVANFNSKPVEIANRWYQFHKNGLGSVESKLKEPNWITDIVDLGESPIINEIDSNNKMVKIAARSTVPETDVKVRVRGLDYQGKRVNTYRSKDAEVVAGGINLAVSSEIRVVDNIYWGNIFSISKDVSAGTVEVYAMYEGGELQILTSLQPEQKESRLRKYLVPDNCNCATVHGIFKKSKPEAISFDNQELIVSDEEAIISMAMGMDYLFSRRDPERSVPFIANGVKSVEDENRENNSHRKTPIQVTGYPAFGDVEDFNY